MKRCPMCARNVEKLNELLICDECGLKQKADEQKWEKEAAAEKQRQAEWEAESRRRDQLVAMAKAAKIEAVREDGMLLQHVPELLKSDAICMAAVEQNGFALQFVPRNAKVRDIHYSTFETTIVNTIDKKICLAAVKQNPLALQYVPKYYQRSPSCKRVTSMADPDICLEAVKRNWEAIQFVEDYAKTKEMCLIAVKQNGNALWYVPNGAYYDDLYLLTEELCIIAAANIPSTERAEFVGKMFLPKSDYDPDKNKRFQEKVLREANRRAGS